jgi:arginyl-tRNA synthetase
MYDYRDDWKSKIAAVLSKFGGGPVSPDEVAAETPPDPAMGDIGFPMFAFAKRLRKAPALIAREVASELPGASAAGPYVNARLDRAEAARDVLTAFAAAADGALGRPGTLRGSRVMVEYSSPNTNKPMHLGHLRNDALGESVSRILEACGAEVRRVCVINDRGIHICKSMLAYKEHGGGKTPESEGVKSDRFVGDFYVRFGRQLKEETDARMRGMGLDKKEAEEGAPVQTRAREMLRLWEAGDKETIDLWKKMNGWAIGGWLETYKRTGVRFDRYYYESETYLLGREEILKGLRRGIFTREEDGSVQADLSAENLGKKTLLRGDGTSIYITQDVGTAILRHGDWPFDRLVFVVGSEQRHHFRTLFALLGKLGYAWAGNLFHLSYGMVNLPDGRMKSREGTVVDADDLIDSLRDMALAEIRGKEREEAVGDPEAAAEKIALGALHYFLLQVSPSRDMLFDPKESLSFNGNTGPYLQYMGARLSSLLRRAGEREALAPGAAPGFARLTSVPEWELIKTLGGYNGAVAAAAAAMDPSLLTAYLYELARAFSGFYHECPVLAAPDAELAGARLALCRAVLAVLRDALRLVCIPFLEAM